MSETTPDLLSHLKQTEGLTKETINQLVVYGYDSTASLMAMDVTKDLPLMTAINMGQKALLRQALTEYKTFSKLDDNPTDHSSDEDITCNENRCNQNKRLINKIRTILKEESNQAVDQMKDTLKKYRQALIRCKHQVTKVTAENLSKDIELKKLNREIFRLRSRTIDKNIDKYLKLEEELKNKDINNKKLEEKLSKVENENTEIINDFAVWRKNQTIDLQRFKDYINNESMVIHKRYLNLDKESVFIESFPQPLQPSADGVLPQTITEIHSTPELHRPNYSDERPPELTPIVVIEKSREEEVIDTNDNYSNSNENDISLNASSISMNETEDKNDTSLLTSSQVVRVSKDWEFQYISPIECKETIDHNYSEPIEPSIVETSTIGRPKRSIQKPRRNSCSEIILRTHSKRESTSKRTNGRKKLKSIDETNKDLEDNNMSTNLVLFSTEKMENTVKEDKEEEQRLRGTSVTLSSITGSKLIPTVAINLDESDGNMTDTNPLTLQQNVISNADVSQIATSNGYLSDSNEENRCSIFNAEAPITTSLMSTHSSTQPAVRHRNKGFRCSLPDCDFTTLFKTKFDDHINNHVTYHFGQEIPDFWRPHFEEFKKTLPQFKGN